jgi:hypothetical protein
VSAATTSVLDEPDQVLDIGDELSGISHPCHLASSD